MNANHEDPDARELTEARLTAYAMGQLGETERAEVEAKLARSDKARQQVEEIGTLAGHVREANRQDPSPGPSAALRRAVEQRLNELENVAMETKPTPAPGQTPRRSGAPWVTLLVAASLLICVGIFVWPGWQPIREAARGPQVPPEGPVATSERAPVETAAEESGAAATSPARGDARRDRLAGKLDGRDLDEAKKFAEHERESTELGADRFDALEVEMEEVPADMAMPGGPAAGQKFRLEAVPGEAINGPRPVPKPVAPMPLLEAPEMNPPLMDPAGGRPLLAEPGLPPASRPAALPDAMAAPAGEPTPQPAEPAEPQEPVSGEGYYDRGEAAEQAGLRSILTGSEQYERIIENEFSLATRQPLSTFSVDVDTASYSNVRRFLRRGQLPPADAVRIEEMVNYFPYDYSAPAEDDPFSVDVEVAECPWRAEHRLVRIGLKGKEIAREQRGPTNLVFLVDVSGSMRDANKLPLVKEAIAMLVEQLTEDDRVAIVTYASETGVRLEPTCGNEREKILTAIDSLVASGSTHGSAGIQLAYKLAEKHFVEKGVNRVILATDGDMNVGITDDDELVELMKEKAKSGVFLTVLGVGTGNLKDSKMEKLADKGNGAYAYLDDEREARKVMVEEMAGSLITIAKDVKLQIEFNPAEVYAYRLVGYENRMLAAEDFDDDKKDAGEIGAGHTVTALYEVVPARATHLKGPDGRPLKYQPAVEPDQDATTELLTLNLRYKEPDGEKSKLLEFIAHDKGQRFGEASVDFRFAASVAAFGMKLRGSPHCAGLTLGAVEEFATGAMGEDPGNYRAEFVELVRRAKQLSR